MNDSEFTCRELKGFNEQELSDLNKLLLQWSTKGYQMTADYFKELIKKSHVLVVCDKERIIGTVTLVPVYKLSGLKGSIEHVMIDELYRGKGLGKKIMEFAIETARALEMKTLFLTCDPDRNIASELYKKVGFTMDDTNFYSKNL